VIVIEQRLHPRSFVKTIGAIQLSVNQLSVLNKELAILPYRNYGIDPKFFEKNRFLIVGIQSFSFGAQTKIYD